jgi:hypothetical protein
VNERLLHDLVSREALVLFSQLNPACRGTLGGCACASRDRLYLRRSPAGIFTLLISLTEVAAAGSRMISSCRLGLRRLKYHTGKYSKEPPKMEAF